MADSTPNKKIIGVQIGDPFQQALQNRVESHAAQSPEAHALPMSNDEYASLNTKAASAADAKSRQTAEWAKQGLDENGDPIRKSKALPSKSSGSALAQEQ